MVFNFALGAPAFFAVGYAGSMFAAEKEEGTFEFLRACADFRRPSAGQQADGHRAGHGRHVCGFVAAGLLFSGNRLPGHPNCKACWVCGWSAALEAIAWGTLFSLLGGAGRWWR